MRLFKYFHPDRTDVLKSASIRFSPPSALNDPFELKPHVSAIGPPEFYRSAFDEVVTESHEQLPAEARKNIPICLFHDLVGTRTSVGDLAQLFESFLPAVERGVFAAFEKLGILCLTESPDNLLMWAHYADAHRGFVVEFDPESPFFNKKKAPGDELRHLRKVSYSADRPSVVLTRLEDFSPYLTKGIDWEYEKEWRMIDVLSAAQKKQPIGHGTGIAHLFDYPRAAVLSVVFGCRMTEEKRTEIHRILDENSEFNHVKRMRAEIDPSQYRVRLSAI